MVLLNTGSTVPLPPPPPPATPINVTLLVPSFRFLTSSTEWFQITISKVEGKNQLEIYHTELTLVFRILFWSFLSVHQAVGEN